MTKIEITRDLADTCGLMVPHAKQVTDRFFELMRDAITNGERIEIRPTLIGKTATVLQLAGVACALFALFQPVAGERIPLVPIFGLAAALTAVAGFQYVLRGLTWYQARPA